MTTIQAVGIDVGELTAVLDSGNDDAFPYAVHAPADRSHLLVTMLPSEFWQAMPGQAVRTAISRQLTWHADALQAAGYGVAFWERRDAVAALIVAATPGEAEAQAPAVRAYLDALNPSEVVA